MSAAYRIQDEPTGSRTSALVFNPFWPLLAMMLAGTWLGVVMFTVNAVTLRSQTMRREIVLAALIPIGAFFLLLMILAVTGAGLLPNPAVRYALLLITGWKLALAYWIFFLQQNSFELYEYFGGGEGRRSMPLGAVIALGGMFLDPFVMKPLPDFWIMVLS